MIRVSIRICCKRISVSVKPGSNGAPGVLLANGTVPHVPGPGSALNAATLLTTTGGWNDTCKNVPAARTATAAANSAQRDDPDRHGKKAKRVLHSRAGREESRLVPFPLHLCYFEDASAKRR